MDVAPQLQPLEGMLLRRSTDIYPKELARDMREFFNSLLGIRCKSISLSSGPIAKACRPSLSPAFQPCGAIVSFC